MVEQVIKFSDGTETVIKYNPLGEKVEEVAAVHESVEAPVEESVEEAVAPSSEESVSEEPSPSEDVIS